MVTLFNKKFFRDYDIVQPCRACTPSVAVEFPKCICSTFLLLVSPLLSFELECFLDYFAFPRISVLYGSSLVDDICASEILALQFGNSQCNNTLHIQ